RTARYLQLKYQQLFFDDLTVSVFAEHYRVSQDELVLLFPWEIAQTHPFGWTDGSALDFIGGNKRHGKDSRLGFDGSWTINTEHQLQFGAIRQQESTGLNAFQGNWDAQVLEQSGGTVRQPSTTGIEQGYWLTDGSRLDLLLPYQRTIQGLYAQSQWQINDKTQLTTGFRYDDYEDVGDNLSLRTGLVYEIDDQQNVKLLFCEAFRAPSIGDTKAEFSSGVVGNPDLQPELVKTIDVIWQKAWMDFALTINGFFNTIDDEIVVEVRQPLPGFNALQPTNKGQQHLSGLELELQANINATIALKSGLSYFNHDQTLGTAKSLAFVAVNVHGEKWNWNINGYYHDRVLSREIDGVNFSENVYLGGFVKLNSKFEYHLSDNLVLHLTGENFLDKEYRTYSTSLNIEGGLPSPGRQLSVGFDWFF
ncbi:MAG: TonB-dependent receptor, partial [Psychrosphaera sp.]|nr:TonB-dependent receptor [Psychrosphaera sp.]